MLNEYLAQRIWRIANWQYSGICLKDESATDPFYQISADTPLLTLAQETIEQLQNSGFTLELVRSSIANCVIRSYHYHYLLNPENNKLLWLYGIDVFCLTKRGMLCSRDIAFHGAIYHPFHWFLAQGLFITKPHFEDTFIKII